MCLVSCNKLRQKQNDFIRIYHKGTRRNKRCSHVHVGYTLWLSLHAIWCLPTICRQHRGSKEDGNLSKSYKNLQYLDNFQTTVSKFDIQTVKPSLKLTTYFLLLMANNWILYISVVCMQPWIYKISLLRWSYSPKYLSKSSMQWAVSIHSQFFAFSSCKLTRLNESWFSWIVNETLSYLTTSATILI